MNQDSAQQNASNEASDSKMFMCDQPSTKYTPHLCWEMEQRGPDQECPSAKPKTEPLEGDSVPLGAAEAEHGEGDNLVAVQPLDLKLSWCDGKLCGLVVVRHGVEDQAPT
ncbi:GL14880 [Drosophila persimilis]|uniref:GL14880 n=1 Tax=Drosophila persimilis TaxID=7234 RepID=B4GQ20_DROPE|nr:GL14880 [Drosophila persimilis]